MDIPDGAWFTNGVTTPADEADGVRRACLGWQLDLMAGGLVASGETVQAVFQVTQNMNLAWRWTNEYALAVSAGPGGSATTASNGWHRHGDAIGGLTAAPASGHAFLCWTGDVPADVRTDNPLTVTMDRPRSLVAVFYSTTEGTQRVWNGTGTWYGNTENWEPAGIPTPMDAVEIHTGEARLDAPAAVASLLISNNAVLVFSNWTTRLAVSGAVTVRSNALVTHAGPYAFPSQMSNRVHLVCGSLTLDPFGRIDVSRKGWFSATGTGRGYGNGSNDGTGAGHGGRGGSNTAFTAVQAGAAYGSSNAPVAPGSGGGGGYTAEGYYGKGGGAVLIEADETVTLDGEILADAESGVRYWAGGSGGSILILCNTYAGATSGVLRANGGNRGTGYTYLGGGAGGRIAVGRRFAASQRDALLADPAFEVLPEAPLPAFAGTASAAGGSGGYNGEPGTVVFLRPAPLAGTILIVK